MKLKIKLFILLFCGLLSFSFISMISVAAYTSDSFSQTTGSTFTWEVTYKAENWTFPGAFLLEYGDRLKITITTANTTNIGGVIYDTLYGDIYLNTAANRTWVVYEKNTFLTGYNGSEGIEGSSFILFIIPHNASAINLAFMAMAIVNYLWTPGPNGYDGRISMWEGSGSGDVGKIRQDVVFNKDGLMSQIQEFNGTGTGWGLGLQIDLLSERGIPSFDIFYTGFIITAIIGLLILNRSHKLNLK
ncbi:MAG: hypothetical protein ACTSQ8_11930 [Candidatus Helarchaeota archaeon]